MSSNHGSSNHGDNVEVTMRSLRHSRAAYDFTDISDSSNGPNQNSSEEEAAQQSILSGVPTQTSYSSQISERDKELNNFPLAMTSKIFFFIACAMFLWMSIDDLYWADEALTIPDTVLEADDDATWREYRVRQSENRASSVASTNVIDTEPESNSDADTSGGGGGGYIRTGKTQNNDEDEDEISWSDIKDFGGIGGDGGGQRRLLRNKHRTGRRSTLPQSTRRAQDGDFGFHTPWSDLAFSKQLAAATLGHNEQSWNIGLPTFADLIRWDDLTPDQQEAATQLGYTPYLWDMLRGFVPPRTAPPSSAGTSGSTADTATGGHLPWSSLPFSTQIAAATLGYNETSWNSGSPTFTDSIKWEELTTEQRDAALSLGYNQYLWDMLRGFTPARTATPFESSTPSTKPPTPPPSPSPSARPEWGSMFWSQLPQEIREAAAKLGYTETLWNEGGRSSVDDLFWNQLSTEQQEAATLLGYSQNTWDVYAIPPTTSPPRFPGPTPPPVVPPSTAAPVSSSTPAPVSFSTSGSFPLYTPAPVPVSAMTPTPDPTLAPVSVSTRAPQPTDTLPSRGLAPGETWRSYQWHELPNDIRGGAIALGFTEDLWNGGAKVATDKYFWAELSQEQQEAASTIFGYTEVSWDSSHNKWQKIAWDQLPPDIQSHAAVLGFDKELWEAGAKVDTSSYRWEELSGAQQEAAYRIFGLTEESWMAAGLREQEAAKATAANANAEVKNTGGGRGGGRGGADDDYVFSVEKGDNDVWVSKYQIVYFVASLCLIIIGIIDIVREERPYHILMVLAGAFSLLASMFVESNLNVTNVFHCFSVHFLVFESLTRFFSRPHLRALLPGPCKNALWMADLCFAIGALMEAILSYFFFSKDDARANLHIARTHSFAALMFFMSAAIFMAITPVVFLRNTKYKPYR